MANSTYEEIAAKAVTSPEFREGLLAAAKVCRAQGTDRTKPPCPSGIAAVYLERLAEGEMP